MKKRFLPILLAVLLLSALSAAALALSPSADFYVTDETGVLSRSTYETLEEINARLEEQCGGQIVVVFVNYFGDVYADEYAVRLFNDWQISSRGMLLVVSPSEGRGGLTVGAEIESAFPDSRKNQYLDKYFWDKFDRGRYDDAVTGLVQELGGWYEDHYGISLNGGGSSFAAFGLAYLIGRVIRTVLVFGILIFIIVVAVIMSDRRRYRRYYLGLGQPVPRYRFRYMFGGPHHTVVRRPPPPRPAPGYRPPSRPAARPAARPASRPAARPASRPSSRPSSGGSRPSGGSRGGMGGRSGGGFGGRR